MTLLPFCEVPVQEWKKGGDNSRREVPGEGGGLLCVLAHVSTSPAPIPVLTQGVCLYHMTRFLSRRPLRLWLKRQTSEWPADAQSLREQHTSDGQL